MEFKKIVEEVDVNKLTGQKENLSKQLEVITQQEASELQKSVDMIKQKYANMKNKLATQINQLDKSVSQEAVNLKKNLDTIQQEKSKQPVQPIIQQKPGMVKPAVPGTRPANVPVGAEPPIA